MKIAVANDHGGLELKKALLKYLEEKGYEVKDFGTYTSDSCDYPDFALPAAEAVAAGDVDTQRHARYVALLEDMKQRWRDRYD